MMMMMMMVVVVAKRADRYGRPGVKVKSLLAYFFARKKRLSCLMGRGASERAGRVSIDEADNGGE